MMFLAVASFLAACNTENVQQVIQAESDVAAQKQEVAGKQDLSAEWTEIKAGEQGFILNMPYADTGNFTHTRIYACARCLLRPEVALALYHARDTAFIHGFRIVIFDAYRPQPYQRKMYAVVPDKRYVADPAKGSMHNRGCAVDVGLADSTGKLVDMGTGFDDFSGKAAYGAAGLTAAQQRHRQILRTIMTAAGFRPYDKEWWHFNYLDCDYPLSDYIWPCI